jgi:hypothetical protein
LGDKPPIISGSASPDSKPKTTLGRWYAKSMSRAGALADRSTEQSGGGLIPSLATTLSSLNSAFNRRFFRLCQIRAMDSSSCSVFPGLKLGSPLRVMPADDGGSIAKDGCNHLDILAFS